MLQGEHSAILLTSIKLPFVIKTFVLSIFEWPFYTGLSVIVSVSLGSDSSCVAHMLYGSVLCLNLWDCVALLSKK